PPNACTTMTPPIRSSPAPIRPPSTCATSIASSASPPESSWRGSSPGTADGRGSSPGTVDSGESSPGTADSRRRSAAARSSRIARGRPSGQDLLLLPLEFGVGEHGGVVQVGKLGQLERGGGVSVAPGLGPGGEGVVLRFVLRQFVLPLTDVLAVHAQVYKHADQGHENNQDGPACLLPAADMVVAEDVDENPDHQEDPQRPAEEEEHRQEYVQ